MNKATNEPVRQLVNPIAVSAFLCIKIAYRYNNSNITSKSVSYAKKSVSYAKPIDIYNSRRNIKLYGILWDKVN